MLVGAPAKRQAALNPLNTFSSVKRLIGRQAAAVQAEAEELPYTVAAGVGGKAVLDCPALGQALLPEEVSAHVLRALVGRAERYLGEAERGRGEPGLP